jgi:aminocarboxymuconate-semialdehyde decarboxylase
MTGPAIDIHTHIVPAEFPAYAGKHDSARWPQMAPAECGHRNVMIGGKLFRKVEDYCWDIARRAEAMGAMAITHQVLSPMPELLSYWLAADDTLALGRYINDQIAAMVERAPDRFFALGTVPMQDPELAAREVERLMKSGKFRGVEIGTNINGAPIGDARFNSFFAAAEEHGAAIFVHALHPAGQERFVGPAQVTNLVGFPCENAFAISSLLTGGMLERYPKLRLAFSHGGGAFALVLKRIMHGWTIYPPVHDAIKQPPAELARRLYYDTLVYDSETIGFLIQCFGIRQLCLGSDFPFDIHDRKPLDRLTPLKLSANDEALVRGGNALRWLGGAEV